MSRPLLSHPVRTLLSVAALLGTVVSCGSPPPDSGYVIDKRYEHEHWEDGYETRYRPEYKCTSDYDYNTKTYKQNCGVESVAYQAYESHHTWVDNSWRVRLENCYSHTDKHGKPQCRRGWRDVGQEVYDKYAIGQHYPNPR